MALAVPLNHAQGCIPLAAHPYRNSRPTIAAITGTGNRPSQLSRLENVPPVCSLCCHRCRHTPGS